MEFIGISNIDDLINRESIGLNQNVSDILRRLAKLLDDVFQITSYTQAANNIESYHCPIIELQDLTIIDGVNSDIAEEIKEFLATGRISKLDQITNKDMLRELELQCTLLDGLGKRNRE